MKLRASAAGVARRPMARGTGGDIAAATANVDSRLDSVLAAHPPTTTVRPRPARLRAAPGFSPTYRGGGLTWLLGACCLLGGSDSLHAAGARQLATGGASQVEGASGGGLTPWASIAGYATREEIGGTAFLTWLDTGDYRLRSAGFAAGLFNRFELSLARQELDLVTLGPALGLPGATLRQDIAGLKVRLFGDMLYTHTPQVALGFQYKKNRDFTIPGAVGAVHDNGVDAYLSATKVFLAGLADNNLFVNGTLRWTDGNETGLLGFGGPRGNRRLEFETSAGVLFSRRFAAGVEYRGKSGHLDAFREDDWKDVFVGWFPNRHFSLVLAYVDLGEVAALPDQSGWYLSLQGAL